MLVATPYNNNHYYISPKPNPESAAVYKVSYNVNLKTYFTSPPLANDPIFWQINQLLSIVLGGVSPSSKTLVDGTNTTIYDHNQSTIKTLLQDLMLVGGSNITNTNLAQYLMKQIQFAVSVNPTNYKITKIINVNEKFQPKTSVDNGIVKLTMNSNSTLVLSNSLTNAVLWSTNKQSSSNNNAYLTLTSNGNALLKTPANETLWSSGIQSNSSGGALGLINNFIVYYNPSTLQIVWMINPDFSSTGKYKNGILHWVDSPSVCKTFENNFEH